jgi:hypothetical protein
LRCELSDLEQVQAERLDLGQYAVQRGLVQQPGEHGVRAVPPVCPGALSRVRVALQSKATAKAARNQHIHACPWSIGSAVPPVARITVIR